VPYIGEASHEAKATILWNQQVQTDRKTPKNKPDIIMCDNEEGTCILIDVSTKKEAEKILKSFRK
jgi:hypothetical protein